MIRQFILLFGFDRNRRFFCLMLKKCFAQARQDSEEQIYRGEYWSESRQRYEVVKRRDVENPFKEIKEAYLNQKGNCLLQTR